MSGSITGNVGNVNVNSTITFTVTASDLLSRTASQSFNLTVNYRDLVTRLDISTKNLEVGSAVTPFIPVTATGGYGNISYSVAPTVSSGNLSIASLGLTFSTANGAIYGTPNNAIVSTSYTITANTNVGQTSSKDFQLTVASSAASPQLLLHS